MNRKKGFTLIELIAVILILGIIALIAIPTISDIMKNAKKDAFLSSGYGIIKAAENGYALAVLDSNPTETIYNYSSGVETLVQGNIELKYNGGLPSDGSVAIDTNGNIAITIYKGGMCISKGYKHTEISINFATKEECLVDPNLHYVEEKCANRPILANGMTPVKWVDGVEIATTVSDDDWYSYCDSEAGKWANAKTADGSYWVWVPRFVYSINTGWHNGAAGIILVQFSKGINDNWNESEIGTIDTRNVASASIYDSSSNLLGFTFGEAELSGFWVAKFEASGTADAISFKPNVTSLRDMTIADSFTSVRNMETNSVYGWGTSGEGIDTHLIKNTEWGAVAYLSKYFRASNDEIWVNPANTFTTGCAGSHAREPETTGCLYDYTTVNGGKASTTGNIYGIYDMVGGSGEIVSAYLNNGNTSLAINGSSLINAPSMYKDIYNVGSEDTSSANYALTINKKSDALYETSSAGEGIYSWNSDFSNMPTLDSPFFVRGAYYDNQYQAGIYSFERTSGSASSWRSFRAVLVVDPSND